MSHLSLLSVFLRECMSQRTLQREPEPDLVMGDQSQVAAYTEAGKIDGIMSAAYLFHSARVSQVIQGCKTVVDLGCGPATQLAQIAELNPSISFHGIDLSVAMLATAQEYIQRKGIKNIRFSQASITDLNIIADQSVDGVISTMALHHLPTHDDLRTCFREISRILRPNGALYLADFGRVKSLKTVLHFAYMNSDHQPQLFTQDYENSLRAAFQYEYFAEYAAELLPVNAKVLGTFMVPFLTLIKTKDKCLSPELKNRLCDMRKSIPSRYRSDLNDMRNFFRMGGLKNDPFQENIFDFIFNKDVEKYKEENGVETILHTGSIT